MAKCYTKTKHEIGFKDANTHVSFMIVEPGLYVRRSIGGSPILGKRQMKMLAEWLSERAERKEGGK